SVRTGRAPLRTRGGCSYGSGLGWFCCRSTALGANGSGTIHAPCSPPSHPGRVLLRVGGGIGFCCRSTAPVRTGAGTNPPHPHLAVHHITTPPSSPLLLPR